MSRFPKVRLDAMPAFSLLLLFLLNCLAGGGCGPDSSGSDTTDPCDTVQTAALPSDAQIDALNAYYVLDTLDANKNCPAAWKVCVSYADEDTAASNQVEPEIIYEFGIDDGALLYDTPYPSIEETSSDSGATITKWCRELEETGESETEASTQYYFSAQAVFAPPVDGSMDVSIEASIQYTPYKSTSQVTETMEANLP